jgi:hypothetical protein
MEQEEYKKTKEKKLCIKKQHKSMELKKNTKQNGL